MHLKSYETAFFKYTEKGWVTAKEEDLASAEFFDIHENRAFDPDYAAGARGLLCLTLKSLTKRVLIALRNFRFRNVATISRSSEVTWCGRIVNTYKDKTAVNIGANSIIEGELLVFPPTGRISIGDWCYLETSHVFGQKKV